MCRFIETLKVIDGQIINIQYHNTRVKKTTFDFFNQEISLYDLLNTINISTHSDEIYKLRIVYDTKLLDFSYTSYTKKTINSLKIVHIDSFFYNYKFEDRQQFQQLLTGLDQTTEIIIAVNGLITDSSYSNLIFKKNNQYFTPESCLLPGTKRAFLLDNGIIKTAQITVDSMYDYENVSLINAMLEPGDISLAINHIIF